ncbi:flippase-like domain-containing protein [candidate division WOR-3 bacterium]|nr:flippase-like domain-containing protein [candidate division WOR-3 bacterium]
MKNKTSIPFDLKKIKKGVALFIFLTLVAWIFLIPFNVSGSGPFLQRWTEGFTSIKNALSSSNYLYIGAAFLAALIQMVLSVLKMMLLTRAQGVHFSFTQTTRFTLSPLFLSSITPLQSGGIAYQLYLLKKVRCSFSKGVAIITFKSALNGLFLLLSAPLLVSYAANALKSRFFSGLSSYILFFYLFVALFFYFVMFRNRPMKKILFLLLSGKKGFFRKLFEFFLRFLKSMENLKHNYETFFFKNPSKTAAAALISIVEMGVFFLVTPCLAVSLGSKTNLIGVYATGMALSYLLAYAPTPGGSGIAEISGISFALVWDGPVTALILLWRVVAHYFPAFFGGALLFVFASGDFGDKKRPSVFDAGPSGKN